MATAHDLASKEGEPLLFSHVEKTLNANKKFVTEFNGGAGEDFDYL
jgi:hypothetical protein